MTRPERAPLWGTGGATRRRLAWAALLFGLLAVTVLVAWQDFGTVAGLLTRAGFGVFLLSLFYVPYVLLRTVSWRLLFPPGKTPRFGAALYAMWIGQSVNALLPVATIGGEVVKVQLLRRSGVRAAHGAASVVVGKTTEVVSLLLMTPLGVGMLLWLHASGRMVSTALVGCALLAAGTVGFVFFQRAGPFRFVASAVSRIAGKRRLLEAGAKESDRTVRALYRRFGRFALSCGLAAAADLVLAGEVWLAAYLMGQPIGLMEAVMLKVLSGTLRAAAFLVPAGLGVLEGAFVMLGGLVGLAPSLMLAVSLATRLRELVSGLPAMLAWQYSLGRALLGSPAGAAVPYHPLTEEAQ